MKRSFAAANALSMLCLLAAAPFATAVGSSVKSDAGASNTTTCVASLDTADAKLGLEAARKITLKYVTNRQTQAAKLANSYALGDNHENSLLHKLYDTDSNASLKKLINSVSAKRRSSVQSSIQGHRQSINDRIGVLNDSASKNSVQGRLTAYKNQITGATSKPQLHKQACAMISELRVYSFWPGYIKTSYKADLYSAYQAQLEDRYDDAQSNLNQAGSAKDDASLIASLQTIRTNLNAAESSQTTLATTLKNLSPANFNAATSATAFFQPYNTQIGALKTQDSKVKSQITSFNSQLKSAVKKAKKTTPSKPNNASKNTKSPAKTSKPKAKISLAHPQLPPNFDRGVSDKYGYYKLPKSPNNELYYNYGYGSNTGNGENTPPYQRYGKGDLIRVFYTVAVAYHEKFPESKLVAGDFNAVAGHASHKNGVDMDVYAYGHLAADMRGSYHTQKEIERSIALGEMFLKTKKVSLIFHNDPQVISAVNAYARANHLPGQMQASNGTHEYHMHVRLSEKGGAYDSCAVANAPAGCFKTVDNDKPTDGNGTSSD